MGGARMQAKDIATDDVIECIRLLSREPNPWVPTLHHEGEQRWVMLDELAAAFDVPWNLMRAKMKRLVEKPRDKRLVEGCACGCRGDFYVLGEGPWG